MESHLLQMRGLKPPRPSDLVQVIVASFTDAWIETIFRVLRPCTWSRIFYRCVD